MRVRPCWLGFLVTISVVCLVVACRIPWLTPQPTPTPTGFPVVTPTLPRSAPSPTIAGINNFEDCVNAGYPVMESYPRQCRTPDGRVFIEELSPEEGEKLKPPSEVCEDLCGDGICQEVVCQAVGCPCPETAESCPQDCG